MVVFIVSVTAILVCGRLFKVLPCDYLVSRSRLATCWHTNAESRSRASDEVADEMSEEEDKELRWKDSGDLSSAVKTP